MIKSAQNYPISSILDTEAKVRFVVPKYQREYVWKKAHWEDLFDDIHSNPTGHFLGSIICINRSDDAYQTQALEVVDGQQRLTTLSLLYAALYSQFSKRGALDEETKHELYNGLNLNSELRDKDCWRVEDIQIRTSELVDEAMKFFAIGSNAHE